RWLGVVPYPYKRTDAEAFLAKDDPAVRPSWAIDAGDGLIGVISVGERLGYWLARPAWRKGLAFEAAVAALNHWFGATDAQEIGVGHFDGNDRSAAVIAALGFRFHANGTTFAKSLQQEVGSREYILTRQDWAARQKFEIETARLRIRPWTVSDAPALAHLVTDEVARMTGSMSAGWSVSEAEDYIRSRQWRGFPGFMLAVDRGNRMIGAIGCGGSPVSLMYVFGAADWGQGFASEACQRFVTEVFDRFPLRRLHADCFVDNPASARVLQKLGFDETGRKMGASKARLEPAPVITYALCRDSFKVPR
ncbi:MAG: GNAT family N-acetyltransferase, partial [Pseudomonadota bacterium]